MRQVVVRENGDADRLQVEQAPLPEPGPGEVRVRLAAAGLNFIDIYHRRGLYPLELPFVPGREGAGTVETVGEGVDLREGDRVAFPLVPGAYAEAVVAPEDRLLPVPGNVPLDVAAAVMLQGLTAHYLVTSTFPLRPGHTALVLAAAGGVGGLLVQMAKRAGARVIGVTSTAEKADAVRAAGADDVILYRDVDLREEARRLTGGVGVDVVYDSVGRDTFDQSLGSLRPRGMMVLYGQASGPVGPFDAQRLNQGGSLFLTRPSLGHHIATREELLSRSDDLLAGVARGDLTVRIDRTFALEDASDAHLYMESGATTGKVLLVP